MVIRGEIENIDRKNQKDCSRTTGQQRAIGWSHDAILMIKFLSKDIQIGFGEVVGNPCKHDDFKMNEDRDNVNQECVFYFTSESCIELFVF